LISDERRSCIGFKEGLDIDAGSMGRLTLDYPTLVDSTNQPIYKLMGKKTK
jgi:hypothetical protein